MSAPREPAVLFEPLANRRPAGELLLDQLTTLQERAAEQLPRVRWLALRPSDYPIASQARAHLEAAVLLLEVLP